jgi:hypothetical protein
MANKLPREILGNEKIKEADSQLKEIRKLGAKPEQRWFGIGPKKGPLSTNDRLRMKFLSDNELKNRSEGMKLKREAKRKVNSRPTGR